MADSASSDDGPSATTVLLVENDPDLRVAYRRWLTGRDGYTVRTAADGEEGHYVVAWQDAAPIAIPTAPIVAGVVTDLQQGKTPSHISRKFHTTLVRLFTELCGHLRRRADLDRVVLSGGVFQNALLLQELSRTLAAAGFSVYTQRLVPPNDGGIALGQAVVAGTLLSEGFAG